MEYLYPENRAGWGYKMLQTILMDKPFLATSGIRDDPELIMVMGVGF